MEPFGDRAEREHAFSPSRWARDFEASLARDFRAAVQAVGGQAVLEELPGCDHFDILDHL
ncbi:hypothetical protein [Halomonas heilongjiangensis]|uniref:Alpha/beta hydrolase n=1 Tax=Halomonas heilongjiangensis TaxID=1387883 RepID=A0A2N7TPX9_9GAMM|nr:hypothetical protein [Halomonas heilongjiangensis]PMR70261.1 hypothetical protein C1H66_06875 [Halomonas heilongjiangensis]PXX87280.1 hypothetical protein CR158_19860 [Halomonas heilongjiangensis]